MPLPFEPETNEDHPDVADGLVAFVEAINVTPAPATPPRSRARIDVDRFLTHVAIENAMAEDDGVVGDQGLNNFYLYEYGQKNRFVFIPWDKDNTFRAAAGRSTATSTRTSSPGAWRPTRPSASCTPTPCARATSQFVNPRWLTPQLETAYQQIRAAAQADARKPFTNAEFEAAVQGLRGVIAAREHDVNAQR